MIRAARILTLLITASLLSGCGLWGKVTGQEKRAREQVRQLQELRQKCERYADRFAGTVLESLMPAVDRSDDPQTYNDLSYWALTQLNSAYTIATGPSPVLCQLDFVVLATLSRFVIEDTLVELDGDALSEIPAAYRMLERRRGQTPRRCSLHSSSTS
jgi:hypothetical protein